MVGNIFGGNTGMSYEQLQRQKDIAAKMLEQNSQTPRNVGEGLSAIGRALAARAIEKRTSRREGELKAEADQLWTSVFGGGGGQPSAPQTYAAPSPAVSTSNLEGEEVAGDTMSVLLRQKMTERGLPEHVADAFIMNFQDESGLNPAINERSPTVPGSRGGFGLAQWTGPRRRQLEAFAASQGKPVSDVDVQLDFLMNELQGTEAKAGQAIMGAQDTPTAATAIVNQFLRPAEQHRASRAAQYGGETPQSVGARVPGVQAIAEALSNPYIRQDPGKVAILQSLLQQQLAPPAQRYQVMTGAQLGLGPDMANSSFNVSPDGRITQIGGGGTNVTVNNTGPEPGRYIYAEDAGLPKGWRFDTQTQMAEQIPGGPDEIEATAAAEKSAETERQGALKLGSTLTNLNLNIAEIEDGGLPVTGPMGEARRTWLGRSVTGSDAVDFQNRSDSITDAAAFAELQNMRDNSPTGGAVGQLTDPERKAIGNSVTALNTATSKEEYLRAAKAYRVLALDIAFGEGKWRIDEETGTVTLQTKGGGTATLGGGAEGGDNIPTWNAEKGVWE